MKPVLIQHLLKKNKGKSQATPTTREESEQLHNRFMGYVLVFLAVVVVVGVALS